MRSSFGVIADVARYVEGKRSTENVTLDGRFLQSPESDGFIWVHLNDPTAPEISLFGEEFAHHPLAVEDALLPHQRPKIERFPDGTVFGVLKATTYDDVIESISVGEHNFFAGDNFVLCVSHGAPSLVSEIRAELEGSPEVLAHGPFAVVHALMRRVVAGYVDTMDGIENDIDEIEDEVFSSTRHNPTERIFRLKRHVLTFQRATEPLEAALDQLAQGRLTGNGLDHIGSERFDDLHDQVVRSRIRADNARDTLTAAFDASLAQIAVRQNEDMRAMAGWAAMIAVPTLLAGIWGMNFTHMPELSWILGYPLGLCTIFLGGLLVWWRLKKNGWL